jgi:hypothetical protein
VLGVQTLRTTKKTLLPTGPNLCRRTQKGPQKNLSGQKKSAAEFSADFMKNGRKGAELF